MTIELSSPAFKDGELIPKRYTADGANDSPPLKWLEPPPGTHSFALICEDPDAPRRTFIHWVLFNLPAESRELGERVPGAETLPNGTTEGMNDFGRLGYGGPSPPAGKPHHYHFLLFALDRPLELSPGATKEELLAAMQGHILDQGELVGLYQR
jgi:Raf kinase inhibitor-like YbhB/YbcL family protein